MSKYFNQNPPKAFGTAIVLYDYKAKQADEVSLFEGTRVFLFERSQEGWWRGQSGSAVGWFPENYIGEIRDSSGNIYRYTMSDKMPNNVIALYSYTAHDERTLSFKKGDIFEVLCRPASDPGWYKVRNSEGKLGLVPRNYVKSIDNDDGSGDGNKFGDALRNLLDLDFSSTSSNASSISTISHKLKEKPTFVGKSWYYGAIKRSQCETLLNQHGSNGDFLIRDSETFPHDYAISLKAPGRNKHFHVHIENNFLCVGQRKFETMDDLIFYYSRWPICKDEEGLKLFLERPLSQAGKSLISYQIYN